MRRTQAHHVRSPDVVNTRTPLRPQARNLSSKSSPYRNAVRAGVGTILRRPFRKDQTMRVRVEAPAVPIRTLAEVAHEWNRRTGDNLGISRVGQIIVEAQDKLRAQLADDPLIRQRSTT